MAYYSIVTNAGKTAVINALGQKKMINLTNMSVGDGTDPLSAVWESLPSEKSKFAINAIYVNDDVTLVVEGVITAEVGGFVIRQIGVYDEAGVLFAAAQVPDTTKPLLSEGAAKDMTVRFYITLSDTSVVNLKVDNSVVLATRKFVLKELEKYALLEHTHDERYVSKDDFYKNSKKITIENGVIDLNLGRYFVLNLSAAVAFSVINKPEGEEAYVYFLELINAGNYTVTWQSGVQWNKAQAPSFEANKVDIVGFLQTDKLRGFRVGKNIAR
ncbi:phage tail protein [Campylobacter fetus]|uniref:phage tail protein n=1 Tax=Campylobacter fetus TaxID=196 RepID=UPI00138E231A|nr:phage tail protein [Campylobacter fetus]